MHKIFLMGPQGSGKGTQAERLSERLGIPFFGTGQLIREEVASGSEFGMKLKHIILRGELISDVDAAFLLQQRLKKPDTQNGYILDGYPRNLSQYRAFDFDMPTHVIVIDVSREESLRRLGGRLTCRACNRVGSMSAGLKPGDNCPCGGEWNLRDDDAPEAITRRLEIYEKETALVIAEYQQQGIVKQVDGMGTVEDVFERIMKVL
ncbi:nucleoside monophosphate kinase [Candidatus Parcubacteria bacterium]|nr:nucleoside monophosphate kinase [Candidatus Parcubacteria bacterium]